MQFENFELESPAIGQVVVKVQLAAINAIDRKVGSGEIKILTGNAILRAMGLDFSGTVLCAGPSVNRFSPAGAVSGMARLNQSAKLMCRCARFAVTSRRSVRWTSKSRERQASDTPCVLDRCSRQHSLS